MDLPAVRHRVYDELIAAAGARVSVSSNYERFVRSTLVAIDTETTGLQAWQGDRPFAVSMCNEYGDTWYCEWPVNPFTREVVADQDDVEFVRSIVESPDITKVFHNGKFDIRMLDVAHGIMLVPPFEETHFAARACESLEPNYQLKDLAFRYVGIPKDDQDELQEETRRLRPIAKAYGYKIADDVYADYWLPKCFNPQSTLCRTYAILDVQRTLLLWRMYEKVIDNALGREIYEREKRLWWTTYRMESRGVFVNVDKCREEWQKNEQIVAEARQIMHDLGEQSVKSYMEQIARKQSGQPLLGGTAPVAKITNMGTLLATIDDNDEEFEITPDGLVQVSRPAALVPTEQVTEFDEVEQKSLKRMILRDGTFAINPNSARQLLVICKARGLEPKERTSKGELSMSFNSIRTIADDPFIHQLQRFRAANKVNHTFIDKYLYFAIPDQYNQGGWCLHPMFNQAAAQTGRYGCSYPNLQQVVNANGARNAVETMSARMAFGPRPGWVWWHFDYSQLELYLFAGMAGEKFMLHHMMSGHDLHAECANKAWGGKGNSAALIKGAVALEVEGDRPSTELVKAVWDAYGWDPHKRNAAGVPRVLDRDAKNEFVAWWLDTYGGDNWDIVKAEKALGKKVARTRAKFVMYAKIYGGGWRAINNFLYCGEREAKQFQMEYDRAFPRIKAFLREMVAVAERQGYIINPYGRKVTIPEGYAYKVVNYLVQSSAADLLKDAMIRVDEFVQGLGLQFHMLLTIHDELVFEALPEHSYIWVLREIKRLMEDHGGRFSTPIPVECAKCVERWDVKVPQPL